MNIALFSDSYIPTKSGIVTVVVQLRKALEQLGHNVVIVTVEAHGDAVQPEEPDVLRVTSIPSPVGDGQYLGLPHKKLVLDFLQKHHVELIHAHTEFFIGHMGIVAGRELGIPVVATTHTMWEDYYKYYLAMGKIIPRRVIRKGVQLVYKKFYAFINVSQKAHDYFNKPFMLPHIPSAIVPNAIDTCKFTARQCTEADKAALRSKFGIREDDRVVLYVGRVVEEKRVIELLEIMKRVVTERNNAKMLFVGDGGAYDTLVERVQEAGLGDRILFAGFVDWTKLSAYYAIGSIFVTVSLSEMHSMTILEALSLGLPVVCRRDTSFADTVFHGKDGYEGSTDDEVVSYLIDLIDNPDKCAEFGRYALEVSRRFSLDIHGRRTIAFYQKVLEKFPGPVSSEELQAAVDAVELKQS
ncbi:MAG: glycosyltransferase [Treponema sp.]|jgi:1,2-diacylglycerol 3-alpha-glucosyltransferase|nr:glycosyltransferase [Treponema sp.]